MRTYPLAKEYNIGFNEATTPLSLTPGYLRLPFLVWRAQDTLLHGLIWVWVLAVYAALCCEAPMCFDDLAYGYTSTAFEGIDVLSEAHVEETTCREELDE